MTSTTAETATVPRPGDGGCHDWCTESGDGCHDWELDHGKWSRMHTYNFRLFSVMQTERVTADGRTFDPPTGDTCLDTFDTAQDARDVAADLETVARLMDQIERQPLPPVTCTPWCSDGNGHGGALFAGDQRCISVPVQIPGSLLRPDPEDTSGEPEYVCVYGEGWANDALPPQIHVGQSEAAGLKLTVDEARQVAAALIAAADVVEGGAR
jgi:hypothetical protein